MKKSNPKEIVTKDLRPDMMETLNETLLRLYGVEIKDAAEKQIYRALCVLVRTMLTEKNHSFNKRCKEKQSKEVYYMSMEFLVGTNLRNNLYKVNILCKFNILI